MDADRHLQARAQMLADRLHLDVVPNAGVDRDRPVIVNPSVTTTGRRTLVIHPMTLLAATHATPAEHLAAALAYLVQRAHRRLDGAAVALMQTAEARRDRLERVAAAARRRERAQAHADDLLIHGEHRVLYCGPLQDGERLLISDDPHECGWPERITYLDADDRYLRSGCAGCDEERHP